MTPVEIAVLVFVIGCGLATALLRDVLASIIAFAAYSLGIAVVWLLLRAPDVGLTEAAVGAGVTTVLFLLTIAKTVRPPGDGVFVDVNVPALGVSGLLVAALATTLTALPPVGSSSTPVATSRVTEHYLANAYSETGVENAVTAVLAAYRGFDTLGEAVVVFAALIGLLVVLDREVME
ncbi:DUF4040 domain-containing protein [Halobaculum sp. CBA1158]|uniref:DUF4040 domain-containing protein n=1 Tax=Halobaculum sp. CBA1158 TaxID=2904243 RepID=UPI001F3655F4|nr:DUF4040 domain-containing protein [Halobaculum sp. CBA1158]UIO98468.1 DUF4040 domain-containing protein [Halobaculum sp. CBA1158]